MNEILCRQLALDYCCSVEEVRDPYNHFTEYSPLFGRRRYFNDDDPFIKIAVVGGKVLFSGQKPAIEWCRERFCKAGGEWFFEPENILLIDHWLKDQGFKIKMLHPFFVSEGKTYVSYSDYNVVCYEGPQIERFRGDNRWGEALSFHENAPDMMAVTAERDGEILGMAGASMDSPIMWQIGINVTDQYRGMGIATTLVSILKNKILDKGVLPFYGTSFSHLASQHVALRSGFIPAWVEMSVTKDQ